MPHLMARWCTDTDVQQKPTQAAFIIRLGSDMKAIHIQMYM